MTVILTSLGLFFASITAVNAQQRMANSCYDSKRAAFYIQTFKIETSDFPSGRDLCNPKNQLVILFKAFDFVTALKFKDEKTRTSVARELTGKSYFTYLTENIKGVVRETHSFADGGMDPETCEMAIGDGFLFDSSLLVQAAILIHEARHCSKSSRGYKHVRCRTGEFKGAYACDPSFKYRGSYAVEAEFFVRIMDQEENVTPAIKQEARLKYAELLDTNFNVQDVDSQRVSL